MSLTLITNGTLSDASQLNQVINVLMQPSGGTEAGRWFVEAGTYETNSTIGCDIISRSYGGAAVSVSIDTSDTSPTSLGTPTTQALTTGGFYIIASGTSASHTPRAGGRYTIQN